MIRLLNIKGLNIKGLNLKSVIGGEIARVNQDELALAYKILSDSAVTNRFLFESGDTITFEDGSQVAFK